VTKNYNGNKLIDLTGQQFERLFVTFRAPSVRRHTMWNCTCTCGAPVVVDGKHLRSGHTRSCGCLLRETSGNMNRTHGKTESPEYLSWCAMRSRCRNNAVPAYYLYGGRGITICREWDDFSVFLRDMGRRPTPRHSIERVDTNGNYEASNCVWATKTRQGRNTRAVKLTLEKAQEIRRLAAGGISRKQLREEFCVCKATISHVINERLWKPGAEL
jgi:hypothetical protein